jgi:hypothetical protein
VSLQFRCKSLVPFISLCYGTLSELGRPTSTQATQQILVETLSHLLDAPSAYIHVLDKTPRDKKVIPNQKATPKIKAEQNRPYRDSPYTVLQLSRILLRISKNPFPSQPQIEISSFRLIINVSVIVCRLRNGLFDLRPLSPFVKRRNGHNRRPYLDRFRETPLIILTPLSIPRVQRIPRPNTSVVVSWTDAGHKQSAVFDGEPRQRRPVSKARSVSKSVGSEVRIKAIETATH